MRLTSCVGRRPGRRRGRRGWLEWLEMLPFLRHASAGKQNKRACVTGSLQEPSRELRTAHILGTNGLMTRLQASQVRMTPNGMFATCEAPLAEA